MSKASVAVAEAQAALEAAKARHAEAAQAEKEAMAAVAAAQGALIEARTLADDGLPKAVMVNHLWRGQSNRESVVVSRRTAKTITARRPGETHEFSFRLGRGGTWREYPATKGFCVTYKTLEIDA